MSTVAAAAQTADRIDYWIVGMSFSTVTGRIPLKAKASSTPLEIDALGS